MRAMTRWFLLPLLLLLAACAAPGAPGDAADADVVLVGEQHDAVDHPRLHREWVESQARRGRLAALVIEMAERGASTGDLPPTASEADVQRALAWNAQAWPWDRYGPAIMAAVRAGVPVLGGNLPRSQMREAMEDAQLDTRLPAAALQVQRDAIRSGHCGLLPDSQIQPMTRIQLARDQAMAETIAAAAAPGRAVLLLAGAGHVDPAVGVPRHLPRSLRVHPVVLPPEATGKDYCAELRRQVRPQGR